MKTLILKFCLTLIILTLFGNISFAQTQQWATTYNSSTLDILEKTATDNSGNIYITGERQGSASSYPLQYLAKYNSSGSFQWQRFLTPPYVTTNNNRGAYSLSSVCDNSGNVYIAGYCDSALSFNKGFLIKYSPAGDSLWGKYAGIGDTLGYVEWSSMKLDNAGNIYLAGVNFKFSTYKPSYIVAKYNSSGEMQWVKNQKPAVISSTFTNRLSLQLDNSNNICVAATVRKTSSSESTDFYAFKLSNSGNFLWENSYNGPADADDIMSSMAIDQSGNMYLEGTGKNIAPMNKEITCVKFNGSTGAQEWVFKTGGVGGSGDDEAYNLSVGLSNDVYLTGSLYTNLDGSDGVLIKLNSLTGNEIWRKSLRGINGLNDIYTDVKIISSGIIYAVGLLNTGSMIQIKKFNTSGDSLAAATYSQNNIIYPRAIMPGAGNSLLLTGDNSYYAATSDVFLVKYDVTTGIEPVSNTIVKEFSLSQNYPNPFNPTTMINFSLPKDANVTISIYDMAGKLVSSLINNQSYNSGYHSVEMDGVNLSSGTYFYRISADNFVETKKMILMK